MEGEPLLSPGEDGINELTLSNAAYLSQWQGNVPVTLPLDGAAFDRLLAQRIATSTYHDAAQAGEDASGQYSQRVASQLVTMPDQGMDRRSGQANNRGTLRGDAGAWPALPFIRFFTDADNISLLTALHGCDMIPTSTA